MIWVGLNPADKIIELRKRIDEALLDISSKDEEFTAHLTLGRVKFIKDKEKFNTGLKVDIKNIEFEIDKFLLVKSELSKDGSKYIVLETYTLDQ